MDPTEQLVSKHIRPAWEIFIENEKKFFEKNPNPYLRQKYEKELMKARANFTSFVARQTGVLYHLDVHTSVHLRNHPEEAEKLKEQAPFLFSETFTPK